MICDCKYWKPNIEKLNAAAMLEFARNPQNFPKDKKGLHDLYSRLKNFIYCPWCGVRLKG